MARAPRTDVPRAPSLGDFAARSPHRVSRPNAVNRMTFMLPWWLPFGVVPEIEAEELARRLREPLPPQLLDVRTRSEWDRGHIAQSLNVPIQELSSRLASLELDRARPVVAICLSGHRSIPAVRLLSRRGHVDARQLRGGMQAWRRSRLPEDAVKVS